MRKDSFSGVGVICMEDGGSNILVEITRTTRIRTGIETFYTSQQDSQIHES